MRQYRFRRATSDDLDLLRRWQSEDHVAEWWDADSEYDEDDLRDPRLAMWIVEMKGDPFAFMQDYDVHGWEGHHFAHLPPGSRGIDQFIGGVDMVDRGHGTAFIRERMAMLFSAGVPVIATDPHPNNGRAIAAYKKAGFQIVSEPQGTEWGMVLPMEAQP